MTRSSRLQPIAELAAQREQESSKALAETHARVDEQQTLLDNLERFHREYASEPAMSASDPVRLQDYRLFMDRLEHAIARQREQLARAQGELERQQAQWSGRRSHRKALDNATARYAQAETRAAERDEQSEVEEIAALLARGLQSSL